MSRSGKQAKILYEPVAVRCDNSFYFLIRCRNRRQAIEMMIYLEKVKIKASSRNIRMATIPVESRGSRLRDNAIIQGVVQL